MGVFWLAALGLVAAVWALARLLRLAGIAAAYKAKVLCSALFVSGRSLDSILAEDVSADTYRILDLCPARVDRAHSRVTVSCLGLRSRTAVYRPGLGATLCFADPSGQALPRPFVEAEAPREDGRPWPEGEPAACLEASSAGLARVLDLAFGEPDSRKLRRTRAVAVVQDGRLLGERYAPGFGPATLLPGWSMTKGVIGALIGVLVGDGRLRLDAKALLPQWRDPGDPRSDITLDDLLRMRSGLGFAEVYSDPLSDVGRMLFARPDAAAFAAGKPLRSAPGQYWGYSSGTTNVLSRILRLALGGSWEDYLAFPRRALFDRIGMRGAVLEPDEAGDFVGSSFMLASARDWARFGCLYLGDGVWAGERVLPEGWVAYSRKPTPQSPGGCYGAHWWLKLPKDLGGESEAARRLPGDAFYALGHEGQVLTVIPSRRLVAVRLGLSIREDAWNHAAFLDGLLGALP